MHIFFDLRVGRAPVGYCMVIRVGPRSPTHSTVGEHRRVAAAIKIRILIFFALRAGGIELSRKYRKYALPQKE